MCNEETETRERFASLVTASQVGQRALCVCGFVELLQDYIFIGAAGLLYVL